MKKTLLLFVSMLMATAVMAQVTRHHDGFYFDKMSPNGKWVASQNIGSVFIYIQDSDEYVEYAASPDAVTEYYATGIGNCISNNGILVGSTNDATCAYWQDGQWTPLLVKEENAVSIRRTGLRKSYIWKKKIKLVLYKFMISLPRFITGNYRRRINL